MQRRKTAHDQWLEGSISLKRSEMKDLLTHTSFVNAIAAYVEWAPFNDEIHAGWELIRDDEHPQGLMILDEMRRFNTGKPWPNDIDDFRRERYLLGWNHRQAILNGMTSKFGDLLLNETVLFLGTQWKEKETGTIWIPALFNGEPSWYSLESSEGNNVVQGDFMMLRANI